MAPPHIICLPPAGAGPSLYRAWRGLDQNLSTPSLPGRENRLREAVPTSLNALADVLTDELIPTLPARYVWFGYSMGAILAFEITRRLNACGAPLPEALFVLASNPPDTLLDTSTQFHTLDEAAFWAELARIGGTPDEVLAHPEIRELFEPTLRADFRNCETYDAPSDGFRMPCPVHVFVAQQDHMVSEESAQGWHKFTNQRATLQPLSGRHMLEPAALTQLLPRVRALQECNEVLTA